MSLWKIVLVGPAVIWANPPPGPDPAAPECCQTDGNMTVFEGPLTRQISHDAWIKEKTQWRAEVLHRDQVTFAAYEDPAVNWTRTNYVQPQVHLFDRFLYNDQTHEWTVSVYLNDLKKRYGGIDSVLIWPTYPNIGIDSRNQFDLFRAVPGGLDAVKNITREFHDNNVRVLWGYNPWDQSLHDEGEPHWTTIARLLKETGGDGFNGDTMYTMYREFWDAGEAIGHKIVGEMEDGGYAETVGWSQDTHYTSNNWSPMGWGYFGNGNKLMAFSYSYEPSIDRIKWLDPRGRRMTHVNDRWSIDRHSPMQFAHFNGVGYESWENVWGVYMTFTERDAESLRRLQRVWRWLGHEEFIQNYQEWVPYAPELSQASGVFASRFQHASGECAWTVINRDPGERRFSIDTESTGCAAGEFIDLFSGVPREASDLDIDSLGFAAYVMVNSDHAGLDQLRAEMVVMTKDKLSDMDNSWAPLPQTMVNPGDPSPLEAPEGMVLIPRTKYLFQTGGVEIEGGCDASKDTFGADICCTRDVLCPSNDTLCQNMCAFYGVDNRGVDVQFPWETSPQRFHSKEVDVGPFYIDQHLVTNAQYATYLNATGYQPRDSHNFLKDLDLIDGAARPVVWLGLQEARDYCTWAGKRLPHVYEWQLAAQGTDGRQYPWGDLDDPSRYPPVSSGPEVPTLPDVGSYPQGNSVFNVSDMVGLVWQYTDEFRDARTRGAVLKGTSLFNPVLSGDFPSLPQVGNWYFPTARKLTQHNRMLLMDLSYERAGTLGFRCVASTAEQAPGPTHMHDDVVFTV